MAHAVLDASAEGVVLRNEPCADLIEPYCGNGLPSAVNLPEAIKIFCARGFSVESVRYMIETLSLEIAPPSETDADQAEGLVSLTRQYGCGLGDRTCMALAISGNFPALTRDRAREKLSIPGLQAILAR